MLSFLVHTYNQNDYAFINCVRSAGGLIPCSHLLVTLSFALMYYKCDTLPLSLLYTRGDQYVCISTA